MSHPIRNMIMLSTTALALIAAPVLLNQTALSDLQAIAKDKGNGGGNSDGGGGGNGNGGGNGGGSENSNAGGNGNGGGGGGGGSESKKSEGKAKKVADTEAVTTTTKAAKATKTKNLNAQLAGLNSLKRNINGLMNSSDPRMELVRGYVEASAALETATAELDAAELVLGEAQAALDGVIGAAAAGLTAYDGTDAYANPTLQSLNDRLDALGLALVSDPLNADAIAAEQLALTTALTAINNSPELAAVTEQEGIVEGIEGEIAALEPLTTEDALKAALLAAANKNRVAEAGGDAYLTPEIMAWATGVLGVGDEDGLIDDLLAQ